MLSIPIPFLCIMHDSTVFLHQDIVHIWPMIIFPLSALSLSREFIECSDMWYFNHSILTAHLLWENDSEAKPPSTCSTFFPYSPSDTYISHDVIFSYLSASEIFGCMCPCISVRVQTYSTGVSLYNPPVCDFPLRHQWVCVLSVPEWRDVCGRDEPVLLCLCQRLGRSDLSEPRANM